jgi:hypothetical protein
MDFKLDVHVPTELLLERLRGYELFRADTDDGETFGVLRRWVVDELQDDDEDVVTHCHVAWARVGNVLVAAHSDLLNRSWAPIPEEPGAHSVDNVNLLLAATLQYQPEITDNPS